MAPQPVELNLTIRPQRRFAIIDIAELIRQQVGDQLRPFRKAAYCSLHTTARLYGARHEPALGPQPQADRPLHPRHQKDISLQRRLFSRPPAVARRAQRGRKGKGAGRQADSHLTFIAAGLKNCVTYIHRPEEPVYFIELDGIYKDYVRRRCTAVMAYNHAEIVHRGRVEIPVIGSHAIDAFNLKDPRYGLFATLADWLRQCGIDKGCIDIRLAPEEKHVGMTVNEYETLLMRNDLPEALSDPLRYVLQRGKRLLQHPASIPGKMHAYAAYDSLRFYNELLDQVPVGRSVIDRIFSVLSTPAQRILRLKRHIRLLVSDRAEAGPIASYRALIKPDFGAAPTGGGRRADPRRHPASLRLSMQVDPSIFKAYDIRGIYPDPLSEEVAYAIGRAFVALLKCAEVVVGATCAFQARP